MPTLIKVKTPMGSSLLMYVHLNNKVCLMVNVFSKLKLNLYDLLISYNVVYGSLGNDLLLKVICLTIN